MSQQISARNYAFSISASERAAAVLTLVRPLANEQQAEVLGFLAERPLYTVIMAGWIRDNGLVSPLNRGTFYGYRNAEGQLEGVALFGHATLFETRSESALIAFAHFAQQHQNAHMLLGEKSQAERFWSHYAESGQAPRTFCRELLFEQRWPVEVREAIAGLRPATLDDLELVMPAQAQMAYEESGVNPMERDPQGFRQRCARRIEQQRTWVWREGDRLIFKADIIAETPEAIYLEGIYVDPQERGAGCALRCLSQLSRHLLMTTRSVCLLVNEQHAGAQALYRKAGYKLQGCYETVFLQ